MSTPGSHDRQPAARGRHEGQRLEEAELTFWADWRDAVSHRTVLLIVGVLLLQLGFILSYVGAFHSPRPHQIPIAVVAPGAAAARTARQLNGIRSSPLKGSTNRARPPARGPVAGRPAPRQRPGGADPA